MKLPAFFGTANLQKRRETPCEWRGDMIFGQCISKIECTDNARHSWLLKGGDEEKHREERALRLVTIEKETG